MATDRRTLLVAALALVLFSASWAALHRGFYARDQIVDTPVYQGYGDLMARGYVPYPRLRARVPARALPVFVIPALGHHEASQFDSFRRMFEELMWACGIAMPVAMAFALRAVGASGARTAGALLFAALAPSRSARSRSHASTCWPAAITAAALAAIVSGRLRLGHVLLGLGIAAELYPAVLVPLTLAHVLAAEGTARGTGLPRRPARGRRRRRRAVPRARAGRRVGQRRAPDDRPLQIESRRRRPDRAPPRGRARGDDALGPRRRRTSTARRRT